MRRFAVLAAPLSVIAGHDDERAAGRAVAKNRIEKRREGGVGGGDFAEVRIRRESRPERFGRRIRKVRLVEMGPGEPWSADWLLVAGCWLLGAGCWGLGVGDPRLGGGNGLRSCSLRHVECGSIAPLSVAVVVHVEAAIEAE